MKKKISAYVLITLVYFFPFRWAFIEHPDPSKIFDTYIDGGGVEYAIYMLLVILGTLFFLGMIFSDDFKEETAH